MRFKVEFEQEEDGRWIAEVTDLPGVLAYGADRAEAQAKVQALALRVMAERLEHGEAGPELIDLSFQAAWANGRAHGRRRFLRRSSASVG